MWVECVLVYSRLVACGLCFIGCELFSFFSFSVVIVLGFLRLGVPWSCRFIKCC